MAVSIRTLGMLISDITAQAKKIGRKQRLRTLRDLDKASLKLGETCAMLLDKSISDEQLRHCIFKKIPENQIHQAVDQVFNLARPHDDKYFKEQVDRYRRVHAFLPNLLKTVTFQATASGKSTLQALKFPSSIEGLYKPNMSKAPLEAVSSTWRRLMIDQERDSLFILEGLLEQQTSLRPAEIMADTSGVSDIIFGLFWLLGYRFSPRLADIGSARFWRIDPQADYGVLNNFAKHRINAERIIRHWDDFLRVAGSLKLGTVNASELLRSLLKSDRPSGLAMALADLG